MVPTADAFDYQFSGKTAVITGAARGFGFLFASELAQRGANVIITDVDADAGVHALKQLHADHLSSTWFQQLDVSRPEKHEAAARTAVDKTGRIDLWINNAGIARHGASATYDPATWSLCLDIMLSGTFFGAQAAGRVMLEQKQGAIINIASVNGFVAQAGRAAYCAAKAGVIRLTEVLASEWGSEGVRVNAIAPAVILTDLARTSIQDGSSSTEVYLNRSPMRRLGELHELIGTMLYLASDHAKSLTGQTLLVDGGWTADHYL